MAKIIEQREVEPWIHQVEAERTFPVQAAADGSGGLAIGEPFNVWHHHHEGQATERGDFHGTPGGRIQIGKEFIVIEGAELGTQGDVEVTFGEAACTAATVASGTGGKGCERKVMSHLLVWNVISFSTETAYEEEAVYPNGNNVRLNQQRLNRIDTDVGQQACLSHCAAFTGCAACVPERRGFQPETEDV